MQAKPGAAAMPMQVELLEDRVLPDGLPFSGVDPAGHVAFVRLLYQEVMGSEIDGPALANWVNALHAGAGRPQVVEELWNSAEHRGAQVDDLYAAYFRRVPEAAGRAAWADVLRGDPNETAVAARSEGAAGGDPEPFMIVK